MNQERYASAPNDVWGLGVILVNLCCGRNPWKKASTEDPTFLAYLKDPNFLMTILPVSAELNVILRRIFECDPSKRITIPELRRLIVECPNLTIEQDSTSDCALTHPGYVYVKEPFDYMAYGAYPPSSAEPVDLKYSSSGSSRPSLSDGSSLSSRSSSSEYVPYNTNAATLPMPANFWGSVAPFADTGDKTVPRQQEAPAIAVC